jgi:hypothetical protein
MPPTLTAGPAAVLLTPAAEVLQDNEGPAIPIGFDVMSDPFEAAVLARYVPHLCPRASANSSLQSGGLFIVDNMQLASVVGSHSGSTCMG